MFKRYVLLDRDGTIIVDKHYLHEPDRVELLPQAAEGLKRMQGMGFGLAVLTNQSGIGRGYYDEDSVRACNQRMVELLAAQGVIIDGVFFCPHEPKAGCDCRKPKPGLMQRAAIELDFDPAQAFMIGDKSADIGLGRKTGATTILVRTGKGAQQEAKCGHRADHVCDDLFAAALFIESRL
ncbi:D-glycero-beta-D-manno-heptose 1,7-bisphosphate 7-phosphatase [Pseudodesulfovibrio thermohalotolerans]|uniref:D-glycero-beta-D-manno-heptose 1,7-bisphosphate 7-phosphatase n=1 Tax=Pseudodesulfovibrio thermohalotolerans TaxID=2880651 RepID=UPI0022BA08CF|nr:D-glycero-beta-D-manno-heptose 1,7-bisphosphate 7-phosphatase [Pseudodesulfovibrio thermohalotolerans]WFS63647.1 D-glycero-beta-D-manno-heptose 1,7-bisphosphate 7-phosphatase [Pseudodesulfovibrio thermohalotolerans]